MLEGDGGREGKCERSLRVACAEVAPLSLAPISSIFPPNFTHLQVRTWWESKKDDGTSAGKNITRSRAAAAVCASSSFSSHMYLQAVEEK